MGPGEDPYLRGIEVVRASDGGQYLWEAGCEGQPRTRGFLDLSAAEKDFPTWNDAVQGWVRRARRGTGVGANVSPAKTTYTAYFFEPYFQPYGQSWGGPFPPTRSCRQAPAGTPPPELPSAPPVASVPPLPGFTIVPNPFPPDQLPVQPELPPVQPEQPPVRPEQPPVQPEQPPVQPEQPPAVPQPTPAPPAPTPVPAPPSVPPIVLPSPLPLVLEAAPAAVPEASAPPG
jgi:hypothetical protein